MVETSIIYPSSVRQPLADVQKRNPFPCCIKAVGRDGNYEGYYCADRHEPRYYHEWTNAMELTRGGETQCGRPSNYYCDHDTYYQIAGYRNTCPIAGCSGTYFQPAILQLELSKNHLDNHDVIDGTEIHSVTLNFSHRSLGVDVANSSTSTNWGPNFCGFDKYPDLKVLKIYITNKEGLIKGNICVHNQNPPLKGYSGVSATITGVTYEDICDGHINIEYQRNLSTDPGNIYIRDLNIKLEYTNAYPFMYGINNFAELYTSNVDKCRSSGSQLVDVGYENNKGRIPLSKAKRDLRQDVIVEVPKGVTYTRENIGDHSIYFTFKDTTNEKGVKFIKYRLKGTDKWLMYGYDAIKHKHPNINLQTTYYKNHIAPKDILSVSNDSCVSKLEFYLDGFDTEPVCVLDESKGHFNFTKKNIITKEANDFFYYSVADKASCGYHNMLIKMNKDKDITWGSEQKFQIYVRGPRLNIEYYVGTQDTVDNNPTNTPLSFFNYVQNKQNDKRIINVKRTDDFPTRWVPTFTISTDTNYKNITPNSLDTVNKGLQEATVQLDNDAVAKFDVSTRFPGRYSLSTKGVRDATLKDCPYYEDSVYIDIEPNHRQNYDEIFVRGEDSTSFDYDYLVAWEGDNIDEPIYVTDVNIGQSFRDIKLCVESATFYTGLSQIGMAKLKVTNTSQRTLKNIRVELNVLAKDDEDGEYKVTLDEFLKSDGIFRQLESNFIHYNKSNMGNLSIKNLPDSVDDDKIGEENVEILINTLEYDEILKEGDSIEILIPFMSRSDKKLRIQPLIFEEAFPVYLYDDCEFRDNPLDYFNLVVYDSILTNLEIEGETDLLETNTKYCPNECFDTTLTYRITNIDSSHTENVYVRTDIVNDANLIPYQVKLGNSNKVISINTVLNDAGENSRVQWSHDTKYKTKALGYAVIEAHIQFPNHSKYIQKARTTNKGQVVFDIQIPDTISKVYTLKSLLQNVISFKYKGNVDNQAGRLYIDKNNNLINVSDENNDKNRIVMEYQHTYKKYRANDNVRIVLTVTCLQKYLDNTLIFYPKIQEVGQSDELTVFYKICNLHKDDRDIYNQPIVKYNQGILRTTFKTNDYQLIENEVYKDIYAGIDTDLRHAMNIEKRIVEQNEVNIINIEVSNHVRDNKEVQCFIDLGPNLNKIGKYEIVEMNMDDGNTQLIVEPYNTDGDEKTTINWLIGEMKADSATNAQIILKGADVGLSDISVKTVDFLSDKQYQFGTRRCSC